MRKKKRRKKRDNKKKKTEATHSQRWKESDPPERNFPHNQNSKAADEIHRRPRALNKYSPGPHLLLFEKLEVFAFP